MGAFYTMLARPEKYNIHPDVASLIAPYVASLAAEDCLSWSDLQGLSDFILSEHFEHFTATAEEVVKYARLLSRASPSVGACGPGRLKEFLMCASVLASRASSLGFSRDEYYNHLGGIPPGIACGLRLNPRAHIDGVMLSHFFTDTTVLGLWMDICEPPSESASDSSESLMTVLGMRAALVSSLAVALRRRVRRNLDIHPSWLHTLFSHKAGVQIAHLALALCASDNPTDFEDSVPDLGWFSSVKSFLRHWRTLSPTSWSSLCDHLRNVHDGSTISQQVVERFCIGLFPGDIGGVATADCDHDCDCMQPYGHDADASQDGETLPGTSGSWRNKWVSRIKHWQPWTRREHLRDAA